MSVKVAVRLRPFNSRELELNSSNCISMKGNKTTITEPKISKTKDFIFDYSFWSHDGFAINSEGLYLPQDDRYADQTKVFKCVGEEVLANALGGYHCCLFAYGQTGSGKSYSMLGYGPNKGIVPVTCEKLFEKLDKAHDFSLYFSMLEIYNEKIQDLLISASKRSQGGLKVREHKLKGVYVEGLSKHLVKDYQSIEKLMDVGNKNRTIGSTLMNACSSRAHTIISLEFKQIANKIEKLSIINLVDLAGSEKLSKTGASGDRMKEGCSINKSLTVLGLVISTLAEKASGKSKNSIVPFRDSVLTRILQNALGGNSKTLMICALSPSENNYEETLSTLRYADQAKKIKCHAIVNESEQDKIIRELRLENEKLKELLLKMQGKIGSINDNKLKEMQEQFLANSQLLEEYEYELKLEDKFDDIIEENFDYSQPFLTNINEDPLLNGKALYSLKNNSVFHIGKKNGNPLPDLILGTLGIKPNHAIIRSQEGELLIEPFDNECSETIFVNGQKVMNKQVLCHNDRLVFAGSACFIVKIPSVAEKNENIENTEEIDWEFIQKELMHNSSPLNEESKEKEEKIKQIEENLRLQQKENEILLDKKLKEYKERLNELEQELAEENERQKLEIEKNEAEKQRIEIIAKIETQNIQRELEREKLRKEIYIAETNKRKKKAFQLNLERKISKYLGLITETNLISRELNREVEFSLKLDYNLAITTKEKPLVHVEAINLEEKTIYHWSLSKFRNRYYFIKEILDKYLETNKFPNLSKEEDPFWDPQEPLLLGVAYIKLLSLVYLVENIVEASILTLEGAIGSLFLEIVPTDILGLKNLSFDDNYLIEDPSELLGRRLDFLLKIKEAIFPGNQYKDIYIEYEIKKSNGEKEKFRSNTVYGTKHNPRFSYSFHHIIDKIDENVIEYLLNGEIQLKIYGIIGDIGIITEKSEFMRRKRASKTLLMESPKNMKGKSILLRALREDIHDEDEESKQTSSKGIDSLGKIKKNRHRPTKSQA